MKGPTWPESEMTLAAKIETRLTDHENYRAKIRNLSHADISMMERPGQDLRRDEDLSLQRRTDTLIGTRTEIRVI